MRRNILNETGKGFLAGVVSQHSLEDWVFDDIYNTGINLSYENAKAELESLGKSEEEIEDELQDFEGGTHLFGDWKKTDQGYEIDPNGKEGFAATVNFESGNVVVEHSKWLLGCHNTSPCYTMIDGRLCGDLDTPGNYGQAYSLPPDFYRTEETA